MDAEAIGFGGADFVAVVFDIVGFAVAVSTGARFAREEAPIGAFPAALFSSFGEPWAGSFGLRALFAAGATAAALALLAGAVEACPFLAGTPFEIPDFLLFVDFTFAMEAPVCVA